MIMLQNATQTLYCDSESQARKFLNCKSNEFLAALDLGKTINGWSIDEVIEVPEMESENINTVTDLVL